MHVDFGKVLWRPFLTYYSCLYYGFMTLPGVNLCLIILSMRSPFKKFWKNTGNFGSTFRRQKYIPSHLKFSGELNELNLSYWELQEWLETYDSSAI